jgi:hypothetical protein
MQVESGEPPDRRACVALVPIMSAGRGAGLCCRKRPISDNQIPEIWRPPVDKLQANSAATYSILRCMESQVKFQGLVKFIPFWYPISY